MAEVSCLQIHESPIGPPLTNLTSTFPPISTLTPITTTLTSSSHTATTTSFPSSTMNRSGEDLDLSLGLGLDEDEEDEDDYFFERRKGFASASGDAKSAVEPTCVGFDCDSDDEEDEHGVIELDGDEIEVDLRWDSLRLEARNEDFEWEEVDERGDEVFGMFVDPDNEDEERAEAVRNLEWEVLLNSSNWELDTEPDHDAYAAEHFRSDGSDDYIFTAEYDMLSGQFFNNETAGMGRPPAAKFVVETLPSVVMTWDDVVCAVCKEDISVGERGKRLPCAHRYHGECIVPWLKIRNTCPVCRFELPTDDVAYERRKSQRTLMV